MGGLALAVFGLVFIFAGLLGFTYPIACAINACPSIFSSYYEDDWAEILVGLTLVIVGIGMIIVSRRSKITAGVSEPQRLPVRKPV